MASVIKLDALQPPARPDNHDRATARLGLPWPAISGESPQHKIAALIPRLNRYARTLTRDPVAADDLVQDCLTSALRKIDMWEPGTDLRAWLFAILHNLNVNRLRRQARYRACIDVHKSYRAITLLPDQNIKLELRDVQRALAQLPDDQQSLILAIGAEGISYEDASSAFNLPLGTVRSRLARGRLRLRLLTDHGCSSASVKSRSLEQ